MLTNAEKLSAIVWKAGQSGQSYGKFVSALTDEAKKNIYREYEQLLLQRRQEEAARLASYKQIKKTSKKNNSDAEITPDEDFSK